MTTRLAMIALAAGLSLAGGRAAAGDADARRDALDDVLVVMGYVRTSLAMAELCIERVPESAALTRESRAAWQRANADVLRYLESAFERATADEAAHDADRARVLRAGHEQAFARFGAELRSEFDAMPDDAAARCEDYRTIAAHSRLDRDFARWLADAKRVYPDPAAPRD